MNASAHKQHGWWSLQAGRGLWLPSLLLIAGMATAAPAGTVTEQMTRAGQLASSNHWDKAAAAYGAIGDQYRQQAEGQEARFRQGQCLASAEKYAEAIACWESLQGALGATEWKESALLETARTQSFKIGDLDAGLAAFQQYLGRYPQSARRWEAEYQLAGVWFTKGDHARAKTQFAKFLAAHPDAPVADKAKEYLAQCEAALRAAAEAAKRKPTTPPPSTKPAVLTASQKLLRQADAARKREKYTDAITDYQRLLFSHRNTPEYDLAVLGAARCHVELENPKKAVELVEELLRTKPASTNAPAALLLLGELQLEELDQPAAAEATYERLLREHPNDDLTSPARFGLGLALFQQELWGKAKEQFLAEQKARGGPNSERPPTGLDLMIKACDARRPLTPDRQRGLSKLYRQLSTADMLFTAQSYEKALKLYQKVAAAKPGSDEACYALFRSGTCLHGLERFEESVRCYEQFLTKNQDSEWADEAIFCAACLRSQPLGEYPRALELMRLVVDRYPRSNTAPRALFHLAWDHEDENRLQEALRLYERLMQDFPGHRLAFRARENRTYLLERINGKKP